MTITMTNEQMANAIEALNDVSNCTGKFGFIVAKNLRVLRDEAKEYLDFRTNLLVKYGHQEDDTHFKVTGSSIKEYANELSELSDIQCEIDVTTISEEELIAQGMTASQMEKLMFMVEE